MDRNNCSVQQKFYVLPAAAVPDITCPLSGRDVYKHSAKMDWK